MHLQINLVYTLWEFEYKKDIPKSQVV